MTIEHSEQNELSTLNPSHTLIGEVVSARMDKTIVVRVMRMVKHQLYGKFMRRYSKMYVHDPLNQCRSGDIVKIKPSRPISKLKRWQLLEIVRQSQQMLEDNVVS